MARSCLVVSARSRLAAHDSPRAAGKIEIPGGGAGVFLRRAVFFVSRDCSAGFEEGNVKIVCFGYVVYEFFSNESNKIRSGLEKSIITHRNCRASLEFRDWRNKASQC